MELVNQQLIKDTNMKLIYNCIYENRGISRAGLSKLSHLSKTTVSFLVDELIARKFVLDSGTSDAAGNVGRKPNSLEIRGGSRYGIVIRWEKSHIDVQLVDICGTATPAARIEMSKEKSYTELSRKCVNDVLDEMVKREQILGICIIVPAMIDQEKEEIYETTLGLTQQDSSGLIPHLKSLFPDFPVAVLNDTACFAYGEKIYSHVSEKDFAFINFDQGIGAALFIGGEMLGRASASYTQFGHYSVDPAGKLCSCGNRGCLELMIGEGSIREKVQMTKRGAGSRNVAYMTYDELGKAAVYGDPTAQQVLADVAEQFSRALVNMICMVRPRLIILGGKGRDLGPYFLEEIRKNLKNLGFRRMVDSVEVRFSLLDEGACFRGAMKYFFDIHYKFTVDLSGTLFIG